MTSPAHSSSHHPLSDDAALRSRLVALARRWLDQTEEAEDLVQDTWLRTANDGALLDATNSREAWLITVLRHLCIDAWRRRHRYQVVLSEFSKNDAAASGVAGVETPEQLAEQAQRVEQALRHLTRTLPPGDVAMVLLYEVFDFNHAELGELSGRNEVASRQHLRRVLQRLRRADLDDDFTDDVSDLFALCQLAVAQRDSAGLIAVLRTSRPQAMALSLQASPLNSNDAERQPTARLFQIGNLLALLTQTPCGLMALVPLGEALTEPA